LLDTLLGSANIRVNLLFTRAFDKKKQKSCLFADFQTKICEKWLGISCWLLVSGCWYLATGIWHLAAGIWLLASGDAINRVFTGCKLHL